MCPAADGSDTLLDVSDPLYTQIGATFHRMMREDWGDATKLETPVFNADSA